MLFKLYYQVLEWKFGIKPWKKGEEHEPEQILDADTSYRSQRQDYDRKMGPSKRNLMDIRKQINVQENSLNHMLIILMLKSRQRQLCKYCLRLRLSEDSVHDTSTFLQLFFMRILSLQSTLNSHITKNHLGVKPKSFSTY